MNTLDSKTLLKESLYAFNEIPNKKIVGSAVVKDTYELASLIGKFFRAEEEKMSNAFTAKAIISCLKDWLQDNISMESDLFFDNEGEIKSEQVLEALKMVISTE